MFNVDVKRPAAVYLFVVRNFGSSSGIQKAMQKTGQEARRVQRSKEKAIKLAKRQSNRVVQVQRTRCARQSELGGRIEDRNERCRGENRFVKGVRQVSKRILKRD